MDLYFDIVAVILDDERLEVDSPARYLELVDLAKSRHGVEYWLPQGSWLIVKEVLP